jgi:hypothetical protein
MEYSWKDLGLEGSEYAKRDLWERKESGKSRSFHINLPPHGCGLYWLKAIE